MAYLHPAGAPPLGDWHPKTRHLFEYWSALRPGPDLLPGRQHFEPLDVVALWPNLYLVDLVPPAGRMRYRLVGTGIVKAMGRDVTGQWHDEAYPAAAQAPAYLDIVSRMNASQTFWRRGPAAYAVDPDIYSIEAVNLPLARDGRTVDMILAVSIFFYRDGREAFV